MSRFDVHKTEAYVASAFSYHGEIPFLYREFRPTEKAEPDPIKEPGGFKVVRNPVCHPHIIPRLTSQTNRSAVDFFVIKSSFKRC